MTKIKRYSVLAIIGLSTVLYGCSHTRSMEVIPGTSIRPPHPKHPWKD